MIASGGDGHKGQDGEPGEDAPDRRDKVGSFKGQCSRADKSLSALQCPVYAHARASSAFSSKDNRTVILTRHDFLPDRTAEGDLLFTFSSNILDFRRNLSSYLKFGSWHEDSSRFYR